jgi:hypothetical protein
MLLGSKTLETLGLEIGDTARVRLSGIEGDLRLRVVGRAVLPNVSERAQLGTGAVISLTDAVGVLGQSREAAHADLALRLRTGADPTQVLASLNDELCKVAPPEEFCGAFPLPLSDPTDIVNFGRVQSTPWLVGGILATLAAGTLAQVLGSAVRRRRRELAVLKTIGFTRSEVRRSIAAQATTTIGIALVIGIPLGIVIGRLLWQSRADSLGIVNETRVGWLALLVLVPVAFVVANVIAAVPAFAAARTRAATVLRSE